MTPTRTVEVAIVGGGPAGALLGARLARHGIDVTILERSPTWRWRASGVFTSPAAVAALGRADVPDEIVRRVARPIPAMRLETSGGAVVRLTYGSEDGGPPAVGLDRSTLDPSLIEMARAAGAEVLEGVSATAIGLDSARGTNRVAITTRSDDTERILSVRIVVGADGAQSIVARAAGVLRPSRLPRRIGLTFHLPDERSTDMPVDARMCIIPDGYVGIAPVPGDRINIGIVLGPSWRDALRADGATAVVARILTGIQPSNDDDGRWRSAPPCEPIAGAWPLGGRVTRRAGDGWLLVGDAAGFLDPFTGEGLHRAVVSTEVAAAAITQACRGHTGAFGAYDRAMRRRFATKDLVSWIVQAFLSRPAAFEYAARRLAARPELRGTMGRVIGDLTPASRALDPRFLARLLAP